MLSIDRRNVQYSLVTRQAQDGRLRGGDVFAYREAADGSTLVLMADASAKADLGIRHADMLRDVFNASVDAGIPPSAVVNRLNRIRFNGADGSDLVFFASAIVASFCGSGDVLTYASAGHDVALVVSGSAHAQLAPTGPLLGLFADHRFGEISIDFRPGDTLLLGTDGVSEARSLKISGGLFGTAGIVGSLVRHVADGNRAAEEVMARCDAFCAEQYRDDATLAAIYRRAHGGVHPDHPNVPLHAGERAAGVRAAAA